jgi:ABC-type nitrate/sulfonate/bicarbonate transport system permease component
VRRWIALGALLGLVLALGFALAMPTKHTRSAFLPAPNGRPVAVYGALAPYAPRHLSVATVQESPRTVRDALLGLIAGALVSVALLTVGRQRASHGA